MTSMTRAKKRYEKIRKKRCKNVRFDELRRLVEACGCVLDRVSGSHHVYTHPVLRRPLILQKPHQPDFPVPFCWQVLKAVQDIIDSCEEKGDE